MPPPLTERSSSESNPLGRSAFSNPQVTFPSNSFQGHERVTDSLFSDESMQMS